MVAANLSILLLPSFPPLPQIHCPFLIIQWELKERWIGPNSLSDVRIFTYSNQTSMLVHCTVFLLVKKKPNVETCTKEVRVWAVEAVKVIASKNLDRILALFDDEPTVYEPFSNQRVLTGFTEIEPFLKVVCENRHFLFNKESVLEIQMIYMHPNGNEVHLRVTGPVNYLLEFEFAEPAEKTMGKIKKLRIDVED